MVTLPTRFEPVAVWVAFMDGRMYIRLADGRELVRRERRAACRVQDGAEVAARERSGAIPHLVGGTDELDLHVMLERIAEICEPLARARDEDAHLLAGPDGSVKAAHR